MYPSVSKLGQKWWCWKVRWDYYGNLTPSSVITLNKLPSLIQLDLRDVCNKSIKIISRGLIAWITLSLDYCTNPLQEEGVSKGSRSLSFFFLTSGACSCFGYRIYCMVSCLFESIWCQYDKSAAFDNKCSQSQKMPFFGPKYWLTWLCFQLWVPKI